MPFNTDTIDVLYDQLEGLENEIDAATKELFQLAQKAATAHADYELLKNKLLLELFTDEDNPESATKKRTEAQRQAIYRTTYHAERLEWQLAKNAFEAQQTYIKALMSNQVSLMARKNVLQPRNV